MAGEPILIVDDTPMNLKLTRILLVNEGYEVFTAASAEEALELLHTCRPRLILADVQLPGIDGLEMTRRIKQDARTRDILVVALTAFAMKGDEQRALEAGCDGYITKPFNTRLLGGRIRELLDRTAGAAQPASERTPARETIPAAEMLELRHRFLVEGEERARGLLLELDGPFHATEAARAVHQWIGTGGLLGFTVIARVAREVETLLHERPVDTAQVRESLTNLILAFSTPSEARETPVPAAITESLAGKRVALVGLPEHETQRLCVALGEAQAKADFFDLASSPEQAQQSHCDLVVAYVRPQSAKSPWLEPLTATRLPTLFVGTRDDLLVLEPAMLALASDFLMDSWQPDEALVRLSLALVRTRPLTQSPAISEGCARVLVAAGDPAVRALVHAALQGSGMDGYDAANGPEALETARRSAPQAAVLDVNVLNGDVYHVLTALRAEHRDMRIVLLTARQREDDILRGFTLGADDYIVKPFSPLELVARLKRLTAT